MDVARGTYFSLDEVGGRIWDLLSLPTNAEVIVATLAEEYNAPEEKIALDLVALLDRLEQAHLLQTT